MKMIRCSPFEFCASATSSWFKNCDDCKNSMIADTILELNKSIKKRGEGFKQQKLNFFGEKSGQVSFF